MSVVKGRTQINFKLEDGTTPVVIDTNGLKATIVDTNGNEIIKQSATTAAVNEITVTNAATGNKPSITATGGDTNIGLTLAGKGTGQVIVGQATGTVSLPVGAAVTTADTLTVGGVIVPQSAVQCFDLWSHASLKTRNLFYAQTDGWTVTGIVYEPDIAEGTGSVVATVCKVTGNSVAVAATTPMCTAFAVTGTAGTPVVATLTSTGADLVLAATNKIGVIFTGGDEFLDTGRGRLYIKLKRS